MIHIVIGTAAKKLNSTMIPSLSNKFETDVLLKEGTSIESPTFQMSRFLDDPSLYNYLRADWGPAPTYYWISNITYANGLWDISCSKDVLSTYKTEIGESTQIISRCADTRYIDPMIIDNTATPQYINYIASTIPILPSTDYDDPTYIVRFQGIKFFDEDTAYLPDLNTNGCVVFATNKGNLSKFMAKIQEAVSAPNVTCSWAISDFVKDIYVVPFKITTFSSMLTRSDNPVIPFAYMRIDNSYTELISVVNPKGFPIDVSGFLIPQGAVWQNSVGYTYQKHSQANEFRQWVRSDAGSHYYIIWAPVGTVEIPSEALRSSNAFKICYDFGTNTGTISIRRPFSDNPIWQTAITNLGVHYSVTSSDSAYTALRVMNGILSSVTSAVGTVANAAGAALTGNYAGAIGSGLAGAYQTGIGFAQGSKITTETVSGIADWASLKSAEYPTLVLAEQLYHYQDPSIVGYPSLNSVRIRNLSGVIYCGSVNLSIPGAMPDDIIQITNYMKGGFYYE